jgi:flagellin
MRISTNVHSLVAQRYLRNHTESMSAEDKKMSLGERIVSAADDPAGLAISEGLKAKIRSNTQAERNTNDSISLLQVAEGSLAVMSDIGSRLRELAMQASTDTVSDMDRIVIDKEFQAMKDEVKRLTQSTSFNGNKIINDQGSVYDLQIGINGNPGLDRLKYDMKKVMDSSSNFGIDGVSLKSKEGAQSSLSKIDGMMTQVSSSRAELGSLSNRMNSVIQTLQVSRESDSSANSKIRDADMALEVANRAKEQIAQSSTLEMLKIANNAPGTILKLIS